MDREKFKFTEEYIQKKLDGFFAESTKKYVIENLYVFSWESDKLIETRSGLIYEFEIKVSKSDFKNDFNNKKDKHCILEGVEEYVPSYKKSEYPDDSYGQYFKTERYKKPNYFYYAVPEGLITVEDLPPYAGLIYVLPDNFIGKDGKFCWDGFYIVKQAPKIHSTKYSDDDLKLGEKFYYNMLTWKDKYRKEREKQLMAEGAENKMTYAELLAKYEQLKKENKSWKNIVDHNGETIDLLNKNIYENNKVLRAYRNKIKEQDSDFNPFEFEYEITKDEENENRN